MPAVLAASDVFCISSTYEGTPLVLFEALAAGKAIVSTAVDGCREMLEDGVTGLLVPPADAPALARRSRRASLGRSACVWGASAALAASRRYDIVECVRRTSRSTTTCSRRGGAA